MRQAAYPAEDPHSQPAAESLMPVYLYLLGPEAAHIHGQALDVRDFDPSILNVVEALGQFNLQQTQERGPGRLTSHKAYGRTNSGRFM